jgi:hypothetical protein
MELYFNPYPGAAQRIEIGTQLVIDAADALNRLDKDLQSISIPLDSRSVTSDVQPSNFIIVREVHRHFILQDIIFSVNGRNREILILLLTKFSKGKVIEPNEMNNIEDWIVSNIGAPAPILEFAAKNKAIAFTINNARDRINETCIEDVNV